MFCVLVVVGLFCGVLVCWFVVLRFGYLVFYWCVICIFVCLVVVLVGVCGDFVVVCF